MEDHVSRPATSFPRSMADDILRFAPTASYFIGTGQKGELAFRMPMRELLTQQLHCRHGHMIGIDDLLMQDGSHHLAGHRGGGDVFTDSQVDSVRWTLLGARPLGQPARG